jgi:hypothetical protein
MRKGRRVEQGGEDKEEEEMKRQGWDKEETWKEMRMWRRCERWGGNKGQEETKKTRR